jgi:hypothetical protein
MFLSIDWDFCVYNGENDMMELDGYGKVPGELVYDWGHSEAWSKELHEAMWLSRYEQFQRFEITAPIQATNIYEATPIFPLDLTAFEWYDVPIFIADSHTYGYLAVQEVVKARHGRPIEVISLDAHHDLGYGKKLSGHVDCGNWLGQLISTGWASRVTVVYPDWRGVSEWPKGKAPPKVKRFTWSKFIERDFDNIPEGIFICRSSGWTPPWHDEKFNELVRTIEEFTGSEAHCYDCADERTASCYKACEPREWSNEEAASYTKAWRDRNAMLKSGEVEKLLDKAE